MTTNELHLGNSQQDEKLPVMRWLDYPSNSPELGEEIVVMYGSSNKKEVVTWTMKFIGTGIKFRWVRLPTIA